MQYPRDTVQSRIATALGDVRLAASAKGLVGLWFDGQRHQPAQLDAAPAWPTDDAHPVLRAAAQQLQQFLRGERTRFDLPLDLSGGTPFQQAVWQALCDIPYGETVSYLQIAEAIGNPRAVRAVGAANGRNPLSIIVPCHRVIGRSGELTGYGGGIPIKRWLLALEQESADHFALTP